MNANQRWKAIPVRTRYAAAFSTILSAYALSACVPSTSIPHTAPAQNSATSPSPAQPTPAVVPPHTTDWRDSPSTPGNWTYSIQPTGSIATFANGLFAIRCTPAARTVTLIRGALNPNGLSPTIAVRIDTTSQSRTLHAQTQSGQAIITLEARDPFLDAIVFSRGRFAISANGQQTLYIPSWSEVSKVVEDCR